MKERPILFSGPMVRAILEGRKTQTRRVVKPRHYWHMDHRDDGTQWPYFDDYVYAEPDPVEVLCPYGVPGDRLWVRETWRLIAWDGDAQTVGVDYPADGPDGEARYIETADHLALARRLLSRRKRPSIHMPRWASRITLQVTGVRVERVQDICDADAMAEGVDWSGLVDRTGLTKGGAVDTFRALWDSINAKRGYGWGVNPWVWVVTFEALEVPE